MRTIRLTRTTLHYADGMVLHTATSGAVAGLDELRLVIETDGKPTAFGSTRLNIAYLSGIDPETLVEIATEAVAQTPWQAPEATWMPALDQAHPNLPAPARMLIEMAASDAAARTANTPLATHLGGTPRATMPTNQTLFRCDDETLLARAAAYLARGFRDLKLRIGFGPFADDFRRLRLLRDHFGPRILLSADANGAWPAAEAPEYLAALAELDMRYIEQPITADWPVLAALSAASPIPVMLDKSLSTPAAITRMIETQAAPLAHLKLAKLGGLDRLTSAARQLQAAGIGVMIGQMNEGTVSTLAAAHAAAALGVELCELYGADGLAADPAGPLTYAEGAVTLPAGPGLGLTGNNPSGTLLWENRA